MAPTNTQENIPKSDVHTKIMDLVSVNAKAIQDTLKTVLAEGIDDFKKAKSFTKGNEKITIDNMGEFFSIMIAKSLAVFADQLAQGIEQNITSIVQTNEDIKEMKRVNTDENMALRIEVDKQQQAAKSDLIRIHNVRETNGENTVEIVKDVISASGRNMNENELAFAFRIGKYDGVKRRPIICKILKRETRNSIFRDQKNKMRGNNDFQSKYPGVFITEDLTKLRQHMSFILRKDENISKTWSIDGRVKCVKNNHTDVITIDTPYDLAKVGWTTERINTLLDANLSFKDNLSPTKITHNNSS